VTPETARNRFFRFLPVEVAPDGALFCIAADDASLLGVLSSAIHLTWASAASGRLGVGNDERYNKACFDPYPCPAFTPATHLSISTLAERIETHRDSALARDERVTMTGIYSVIAKLRTGEPLTAKERTIHELAACGVLRDLHDELDALVAQAYGWPWPLGREEILERLVALHAERVAEEARGLVRWLRPEYQNPDGRADDGTPAALDLATDDADGTEAPAALPWPAGAIDQIAAITRIDAATARFAGAPRELVARHLETLAILGEVREERGRYLALASTV
jgi:hypothetical protein